MKKQVATTMAKGSKAKKYAAVATPKAKKVVAKKKAKVGPVSEVARLEARVAALEAALKAQGATVTTGGEDVIDVLTGEHLGRTGGSAPLEKVKP